MQIVLPYRFRGPLTSANGGYVCGRLAAFVDADEVEVTLRLPPPLERPLAVESDNDAVRLLDGDALVAEARPALVDVELPAPVSVPDANDARKSHVRDASPDFRECYVCGIREDGLEISVGPVVGREPLHASPMALPESTAELVWAAIDCPGAYAVAGAGRGEPVLGRITARVERLPEEGEPCVVAAWPLGEEGRKLHAGTALYGRDGGVVALARQVWILPR